MPVAWRSCATSPVSAQAANVTKVTDLIDGISKASEEQAQGVDQVNTAVAQMDKVTQQNAAGAEESASAAEQLSAQAQTVKGMVNELVTMVGGKSAQPDPSSSVTATPKAVKKRPNVNVAHLKKDTQMDAKPVVAGTASDKSSNDFMSLDDGSDLKDF